MNLDTFSEYMIKSDTLLDAVGVDRSDVVQSDMLCYDVPSNERYTEVKNELASRALLLDESEVNGRLIAIFEFVEPLKAGDWEVSFLELPQPKSGDEVEGIDHVQFVTRMGLSQFVKRYKEIAFVEKGNALNRLLQVEHDGVKIRFHDKHIGAVLELEAQYD